jgi:hypothetical protein
MVGALSLFVFVKFYAMIFLGAARGTLTYQKKSPENKLNIVTLSLMSLLSLTIGVAPVLFVFSKSKLDKIFYELTLNALLIIGISLLVWGFRHLLIALGSSRRGPTWGCGYSNITAKMEYTADSFSLPLMRLLDKVFIRKENNEVITELYPADIVRTYEVGNPVKNIVDKVCGKFNDLLGKLQFLQSGMMQSYLWISVLFLVLAIFYAIFSSSAEVIK